MTNKSEHQSKSDKSSKQKKYVLIGMNLGMLFGIAIGAAFRDVTGGSIVGMTLEC